MSQSLNVAKKRVVEYANSGWFYGSEGLSIFHKLLQLLDVHYTSQSDNAEYETDFEIERKDLENGLAKLRTLEQGGDVDWVDTDDVCELLDMAHLTMSECITCFEWLLTKSDNINSKEWIYVSFF